MLPPPLTSPDLPVRRPDAARDPRRRWAVAGSVLLHLLALVVLLIARAPEPPMPIAPSYDLLFENGDSSSPPSAPDQAFDTPSKAPAADLPPTPEAEPQAARPAPAPPLPEPPAPPPDLVQPEPPPPEPAELPQPEAASQPEPAPSLDLPAPQPDAEPELAEPPPPEPALRPAEPAPVPSPEPPAVRLAEPEPAPPPMSPQALAPDLPPLAPLPPLPEPALPRPQEQATQRPAPGTFAAPMDLNFGRAAARAPSPRVAGSSRAIDFSLGAPKPGPNKSEAFFDIRARNIGADWMQRLDAYWHQHSYYPLQAGQNGEEGIVEVQVIVNRQGKVESVEVKQRSGSLWLDMAAVAVWRNAQLPPLPTENTDRTITVLLRTTYVIVHR